MHVRHLSVADFRSYTSAELPLGPGVTTLVGLNGQGKTNLAEALAYLATLTSFRSAPSDALVRVGASAAIVRATVLEDDGRHSLVEIEMRTGVRHQIRATLAHLGFPVLGDRSYGSTASLSRFWLHAESLEWEDFAARAPLPSELESRSNDR